MALGRYSRSFTVFHIPLFFSLFPTLMSSSCDGHNILCKAIEREALLHFKNGLSNYSIDYYDDNDVYHRKKKLCSSWVPEKEENCCKWEGIGCDNHTGHVTKLVLPGAAGNISHSLVNLSYLEHLDLSCGDFGGGPIPAYFGSFKKLRYLDLFNSTFQEGIVPSQFGNLSALEYLDLSSIHYQQNDHSLTSDGKWISGLSSLRYVDMSYINLSKATSLFDELNMLPFISYIRLSGCHLDSISLSLSDANFTVLSFVDLSINNLNELGMYKWLFNLTCLEYLHLGGNNIGVSNVENFVGNLCSLRSLYLSVNNIKTSIGSFFEGCNGRLNLERLVLSYNNITGQLASWLGEYKGNLIRLDLSSNLLTGPIPESIGSFKSLQYLDLSRNEFNGHIPMSIGELTSCKTLRLSHNNFSGQIPTSIGALISCQELDLSNNKFDGLIPMSIGGLTSCETLDLSYNLFEGHIPTSIGNLISCSHLYLCNNNFSGNIPSTISKLVSLQYLDLSGNSLDGIVSKEHFLNISQLDALFLSGNSLEITLSPYWIPPFSLTYLGMALCKVGPQFPLWLQTQVRLGYLNMSSSSIGGILPQWIWNFSSVMTVMDLSNNMLGGYVPIAMNGSYFNKPPFLCNWRRTFYTEIHMVNGICYSPTLNLQANMLKGTLSSFPIVKDYGYLTLSNNSISGPVNLRDVSMLSELDVSMNDLNDTVPSFLCNASNLYFLDLSDNHLSGQLPSCLGKSSPLNQSCSILVMRLHNNILQGSLPAWLKNCNNMQFLDIGNNGFTGNIPIGVFRNMWSLKVLQLSSNMFYGKIPKDLSSLEYLHVLDLSKNYLSGVIPHNFRDLVAMKSHNSPASQDPILMNNYLDVTFKGEILRYNRLLNFFWSIDLSENELSGEMPEELGELFMLVSLNLSHNYFMGNIPRSFGNLAQLESLDLSRNNLSGSIPQSLAHITYLTIFNVSFNNLSGTIPTGLQFDTFESSSYLGNKMLCGKPLNACQNPQQANVSINKHIVEDGNSYCYFWLYICVSLGYIMGFLTFWITLFFIKSIWRYAYFRYIDEKCKKLIILFQRRARNTYEKCG